MQASFGAFFLQADKPARNAAVYALLAIDHSS
jgi:hypothetical protein